MLAGDVVGGQAATVVRCGFTQNKYPSGGQAPVPYSSGSWKRKQKGFPCDLTKTWVPTNHPCDAIETNTSQTQTLPGT